MQFFRLITERIEDAKNSCIALIGGGGKTALLHNLANEYSQIFPKVLQTSITKTAFHTSDKPLILNDIEIPDLNNIIVNPLFVIGEKLNEEKLKGISNSELDEIRRYFNITIFECDGARNKPLKVHTDYDPMVPLYSTDVIIIVGADVVNTKISDGLVHRPEMFCEKWDVTPNKKMDIDFIVNVISTNRGYLSKINHDANLTYFVNKADKYPNNAMKLANAIFYKTEKPTFYGSTKGNFLEQVGNK